MQVLNHTHYSTVKSVGFTTCEDVRRCNPNVMRGSRASSLRNTAKSEADKLHPSEL